MAEDTFSMAEDTSSTLADPDIYPPSSDLSFRSAWVAVVTECVVQDAAVSLEGADYEPGVVSYSLDGRSAATSTSGRAPCCAILRFSINGLSMTLICLLLLRVRGSLKST